MSFTCPNCGAISHHPEDERNGYCGRCHEYTALKAGDVLRVRRCGSEDEWCVCSVLLASTNGESLALRMVEGMLRLDDGGTMSGALGIHIEGGGAHEVFTSTELEVERRA